MADAKSASTPFRSALAVLGLLSLVTVAPIELVATPTMSQTLGDIAMMAPKTKRDAIFGSIEFERTGIHSLPQWRRVARDLDRQLATLRRCVANEGECKDNRWVAWRRVILDTKGMRRRDQLDAVNSHFNKWQYRQDADVYDEREYWASPLEFISNSGDCEDYAIIKFATLLALGVPEERMRVVVIFDRIRQVRHAVLAYYSDDRTLILDSLSDYVFEDKRYTHYIPEYSLTRNKVWTHARAGN